jgi:protein required for attachment to host cells
MNHTTTWMLVAQSTHARIFATSPDPKEWRLVRAFEHAASRAHDHDLVTDRAGRSLHVGREGYGSGLEQSSPHREEGARFAKELAAALDDGLRGQRCDELVIVAPPRLLGLVLGDLSVLARAAVTLQVPHDYASLSPEEIDQRVRHVTARADMRA